MPFLEEFGFRMETPSVSGRLYCVNFTAATHTVFLSYEPGDGELFVVVSSAGEGLLADFDDRGKSPRLADLNALYMKFVTADERRANDNIFSSIIVKDKAEHRLLKVAKELRLVLPKYLDDSSGINSKPPANQKHHL